MKPTSIILVSLAVTFLIAGYASPGQTALQDEAGSGESASLTGRLLYSNGQPVSRVPVFLRDLAEEVPDHSVLTGEDGRFVFEGLKQGPYRLFEIRVYFDGGQGKCEVLEKRDVDIDQAHMNLGDLKLVPKTIMPIEK